jgi:hypothetical protein
LYAGISSVTGGHPPDGGCSIAASSSNGAREFH